MFQDSLTKKIAEAAAKIKTEVEIVDVNEKSVEGAVSKIMNEKLVGDQHKIDANKNNKVDAHDFKLLRAQKEKEKANSQKFGKSVKEEVEELDEAVNEKQIRKDLDAGMSHHAVIGKHANKKLSNTDEIRKVIQKHAWDKRMKKEEVVAEGSSKQPRWGYHIVDQKTGNSVPNTPKFKTRQEAQQYLKTHLASRRSKLEVDEFQMKEEVEELSESHFKVGDEVICKASGMEGEVVKVDPKEEGKYYTVKREDGKMVKYAPDELKLEDEDEDEEDDKKEMKESAGASKDTEEKFHKKLDTLVHKAFGHSPAEKKEKMKKEETEIDEAMFPGTKEYEKKYGQSPQQKLKKKGDTVPTSQGEMKKTEKGVMHSRRFSEMISAYQEEGLKYINSLVKEEPDNEQFTKEVEEQKKRDRGEIRNDKGVAKAFQSASVREEPVNPVREDAEIQVINADIANGVKIDNIEERSLTEPEMKKKEEIVKSMKKGMAGFKERYGDRAKEVMYATATARAKGE